MAEKSYAQAVAQFDEAVRISPESPEVRINLVDAELFAGERSRAVSDAQDIERLWTSSPKILYTLGLKLFEHQQFALAAPAFAQAWQLLPKKKEIGLRWIRCQLEVGEFIKARDALLKMRAEDGDSDQLEVLLAMAFAGSGDLDSALETSRRAVSLNPQNPEAHWRLGEVLFQRADVTGALPELETAQKLSPDDQRFTVSFVRTLIRSGRDEDAERFLERHSSGTPVSFELTYLRAIALINLSRFAQAVSQVESAIRLSPRNDLAQFLLGYSRSELDDIPGASQAYREAIRLNPNVYLYYNYFASLLERQGELGDAASYLEKSMALQPNVAVTYYGLGKVLVEMGKYHDAIRYLNKSIEFSSAPARAYYLLATCYERTGNPKNAGEFRRKFATLAARSERDEYVNLSGDLGAISFGRSLFALPPPAIQKRSRCGGEEELGPGVPER